MGDKKRDHPLLLAAIAGVLGVGLLGQVVTGCGSDRSETPTNSPSAGPVPDYRLQVGEKPSTLNVYVTALPTEDQASQIVGDLQNKYAGHDDGYFVSIYCEESGQFESGNRLVNAKFAIGNIGAARTGLNDGESEIRPVANAQCPAATAAPAASNSVTAEQVVEAIVAAGLPARDPRDNSSRMCQSAGCTQLITTDDFSVYQFPDVASATKWASVFPLGYQNETIFLRYKEGGSDPTNPALIPQYNAVLDDLMAGR